MTNKLIKYPLNNWKLNFCLVVLVYIVAHIPMLLSNGVWWDDWTVWNVTGESLYAYLGPNNANEVCQYTYIKLITKLFSTGSQIYIFHLISFIVHGISLLCFWFILKKITTDIGFTTMCSLLIASFGMDTTSMLIICSHYAFANCFFFIGLLTLIYEAYNEKPYLLFITGITWLCSLLIWRSAAMLMPFCLLTLSFFKTNIQLKDFKSWLNSIKYVFVHYWQIIVIVSIFIPLYILYFGPAGSYSAEYTPRLKNVITSPITSIISAIISVPLFIKECINGYYGGGNFYLILLSIFISCLIYSIMSLSIKEKSDYKWIAVISLLYLAVSTILQLWIYSYLEIVDISEYRSRVLSLGALPISIIVTYLLCFLPHKVKKVSFAILLSGSMLFTMYSYIDYIYAFSKSEIVAEYFHDNDELKNKQIRLIDYSYEYNENKSTLRYYAYEGMSRMAYGQDSHTKIESVYRPCYGEEFVPDYVLYIEPTRFQISTFEKCQHVFYKLIYKHTGKFQNNYKDYLNDMLIIHHEKITVLGSN